VGNQNGPKAKGKGKRLTNAERNNFNLDSYLKQVLVGTIIGDVYMRRFSKKANVRIIFRQGSIHASYLIHLYCLFQEFVLSPHSVSTITDKITGKIRYNLSFATLALPCFNELYLSLYLDGKKIIPSCLCLLPLFYPGGSALARHPGGKGSYFNLCSPLCSSLAEARGRSLSLAQEARVKIRTKAKEG
jgi:hypothetical protein